MGARPLVAAKRALEDAEVAKPNDQIDAPASNEAAAGAAQTDPGKTGLVVKDENEVGRNVARKMGWRPKEEWDRDPANWRDWDQFLEQTPEQVKSLQERARKLQESNQRNAQAAAAAIEETRRQAVADAEARLRAAVEAQDPEAAVAAGKELAKTAGPAPETVAWVARNPWFENDPEAQAVARATVERSAKAGATIPEQLEAAEASVRKRFPEHFDAPREEPKPRQEAPSQPASEVRLSDALRRAAPAVTTGSRTGSDRPREKGFEDIPSADQQLYKQKLERKFLGRMTVEEARARWAKSYWANKDNG